MRISKPTDDKQIFFRKDLPSVLENIESTPPTTDKITKKPPKRRIHRAFSQTPESNPIISYDYKQEIEEILTNYGRMLQRISPEHSLVKKTYQEATTALTHLINKAVVKELDDIYDSINTGNVYLALGKVKRRIKELEGE